MSVPSRRNSVQSSTVQLLEGIGAISKADGKKAAARGSNYQDNVMIPLVREHDDDATADDEQDGDSMVEIELDIMLSGVEKVGNPQFQVRILFFDQMKFEQLRKIIKGVRSSPQRRQSWAREILFIQGSGSSDDCSASLMLILDVRTRWASTHQMLRASNVTLLCTSPVYQIVQDKHSTIAIQLTHLFRETRISTRLSSATLTGSPLSW
jgi:hypothetical protein